jgi:alpha-ketoglutarate-dependent taurine dioxygenase
MKENMNINKFENFNLPLVISPTNRNKASVDFLLNWISSEREKILQLLYKYGALLFRDFEINNIGDFETITKKFVGQFLDYKGGDSPRDKIFNNIYTSTHYPPHLPISLHNELSFSNKYPKLLFFYCDIQPQEGGETPIADGRKILKNLKPILIEKFNKKQLKYIMNLHDGYGIGKSWKECFETDNPSEVENILNSKNAEFSWGENYSSLRIEEVVQPIIYHPETGEKVFFSQADQWHPSNLDKETYEGLKEFLEEEDFYHYCEYADGTKLENEELNEIRTVVEDSKISFPWQKGDILLIDNILTLHGRNPYKGNRKIYICMA